MQDRLLDTGISICLGYEQQFTCPKDLSEGCKLLVSETRNAQDVRKEG